ncbi:hypothetical protein GF323_03745 [Candidatus Woesearchaeota archaeon]|nr:hypothetical protein [Candidatus Woesearchaeota archaeon]
MRKAGKSGNMWERRIAILATYAFIRNGEAKETLKISKMLVNDEHDLIHKGGLDAKGSRKKCNSLEEEFLKKHYKRMPRTMLRYAIERFDKKKRILFKKIKTQIYKKIKLQQIKINAVSLDLAAFHDAVEPGWISS